MPNLIVNPIGGLANRMRSIASAVSLANSCGIEKVKVIWSVNDELAARFDDIFLTASRLQLFYPSPLTYSLKYSPPRKKNLFISALPISRYGLYLSDFNRQLREIRASENPDKLLLSKATATLDKGLDCYIQSGCIFYPFINKEYRRLFQFRPEIEEKAREILETLGENVVGIHIRRTDNSQSILHSPDELFFEEMDRRIARDHKVNFYLATDDEAVKRNFKARYGDRLVTSSRPANRTSRGGIIDAAVEMCTLSKTKEIIGSHYSSFSEAASLFGSVPLLQVFKSNNP